MEETNINFGLGLFGSIIGAAIGSVVWIVIAKLGFFAAVAGFLIVYLSIEFFKAFGRGLDTGCLVTCVIISIIAVFAACWISYLMALKDVLEDAFMTNISFTEANNYLIRGLRGDPKIHSEVTHGFRSDLTRNLLMGYILAVIGGVFYIKAQYKAIKAQKIATEAHAETTVDTTEKQN